MPPAPQWRFGPFRLDTASGSLWQGDDLIPLRPKLYALLATLVAHAGEVMTKEALLDAGWPEMAVSEGVLKTCMAQVRQALGETATAPTYIATVHRRGYRFIAPVLPVEASADTPPSQVIAPGVGPAPVTALVSRESELDQLYQCWRLVRQGIRQIVMVTGEAGIGKTSVVDAFVAQLAATETFWVGRGQCIEQYGAGEAYLPLLEVLGELGRRPDGTHLLELLHEQAPSWLLQLPALVPFEAYDALQRRGQGATQARMLRELAEAVESLTVDRPLVMVLEDLHWSDVSTLDWLSSVARRRPAARLLVLGTYRPTDAVVHQHPVHAVIQELLVHGQCRELALGYVHEAGIATYLAKRFGECIWLSRLAHVLHQRTRGNPLFLITVVDELVRQGTLMPGATGWELEGEPTSVAVEVPENLWQVIERQRVQLATEDQMLLEAASVAGVEFAAALVASCVDRETEALEARYDTLARQGQFVQSRGTVAWPDGTVTAQYAFRHALYHEFLYARVPASRQVRWHRQFGRRLEAAYGSQTSEIAAALTMHYVRGQDAGRAVHYLHKAGEQAVRRSASQEALPHLTTALELLKTLPDTPESRQQELLVQTTYGTALVGTQGYAAPDVLQAYARARELCRQVGETSQLFPILEGLAAFYANRAEYQTAQELGEALFTLAQRDGAPALLARAHTAMGALKFWQGQLVQARVSLAEARAFYEAYPQHALPANSPHDLRIMCSVYATRTQWVLGYPDRALTCSADGLMLAQALSHPLCEIYALYGAAICHQWRGDLKLAHKYTELVIARARDYGSVHWEARGMLHRGIALSMQGRHAEAITQLQQALASWQSTGAEMQLPYFLSHLAAAYGRASRAGEGLHLVAEAQEIIQSTGEWVHDAEVRRVQGELLLAVSPDHHEQAQDCFLHACTLARRQQAKSWELRAASSLARLWQRQGKRAEAIALLQPVYDWFTEGFDTADLRAAQALLDSCHPLGLVTP